MTTSDTQKEQYFHILQSKNWKQTSYKSAPDEIIDAYEAGRKAGLSQNRRIILKKFEDNLRQATSLSQDLFISLNSIFGDNFCKDLFLKIEGIAEYEALFIVDKDIYVSSERNKAFEFARELKKKSKGDLFSINFSFLPNSDQIDVQNIFYDGYALKYEPQKDSKSRKA